MDASYTVSMIGCYRIALSQILLSALIVLSPFLPIFANEYFEEIESIEITKSADALADGESLSIDLDKRAYRLNRVIKKIKFDQVRTISASNLTFPLFLHLHLQRQYR